ncbi:MAG: hypothetical protein M1822_007178 [Bathelium mastoideum]|nr:MAG: hypothetical protein M1822_007178 [Bathelium mastoideum]
MASVESEIQAGLLACYDFASGESQQLVRENVNSYQPLQLWQNEKEVVSPDAIDSCIKRAEPVEASFQLDVNPTSRGLINRNDPYLVFPSLGPEVTHCEDGDRLPSISIFFKQDPETFRGVSRYMIFGGCMWLMNDQALNVTQKLRDGEGKVYEVVVQGRLSQDRNGLTDWHHIYWRLAWPGIPPKLFIDGIDYSRGIVGGDIGTLLGGARAPYSTSFSPYDSDVVGGGPPQWTIGRGSYLWKANQGPTATLRRPQYSRITFFNANLSIGAIKYLAEGNLPYSLGLETVSPANYLSLDLDRAYAIIRDKEILKATFTPYDFSINLWFQYHEQISELVDEDESDKFTSVVSRTGLWSIGVTSTGRLLATISYYPSDTAVTLTTKADCILPSSTWNHVSLAVSAYGEVTLFWESAPVANASWPSDWPQWRTPDTLDAAMGDLRFGSDNFSGEIRSMMFFNLAQDAADIRRSMYYSHLKILPKRATAYFHLHQGANPEGLVGKYPIIAMLADPDGYVLPRKKSIDMKLSQAPEVGLKLNTDASFFSAGSYADCGLDVLKSSGSVTPISFDGWFMLAHPHGEDAHDHRHTILSIGKESGDGSTIFRLAIDAQVSSGVARYELKTWCTIYDYNPSKWSYTGKDYKYEVASASWTTINAGDWYHFVLTLDPLGIGNIHTNPGQVQYFDVKLILNGAEMKSNHMFFATDYSLSNSIWPTFLRPKPVPRPFIIGADLDQDISSYIGSQSNLKVTNCFSGWMRTVRVWSSLIKTSEAKAMYDWAYEPDISEPLLADFNLTDNIPIDLTGRNQCKASPLVQHALCSQRISPGSTEDPLPSLPHPNPSAGPVSKRGLASPEVLLAVDLVSIAIGGLTPAKVNMTKLIVRFETIMADADKFLALMSRFRAIQTAATSLLLSAAEKGKQIAGQIVRLFKWFWSSGLLRAIASCFSFNFWGLGRFVVKFVPFAGEAEIALELLVASVGIAEAFRAYAAATEHSVDIGEEVTPKLAIHPTPDMDAPIIIRVGDPKMIFTVDVEPKIRGDTKIVVTVLCDQGLNVDSVLRFNDTLTFSDGVSEQKLEIEAIKSCLRPVRVYFKDNVLPEISILVEHHEFELLPPEPLLEWSQQEDGWNFQINMTVMYTGLLRPDQTVTWRPRLDNDLKCEPDFITFAGPVEGPKSTVKRSAPVQVTGSSKKAKADKSEETIESEGEIKSSDLKLKVPVKEVKANASRVQETIDIYAINAGRGDCFTLWIDATEQEQDDAGNWVNKTTKIANAVIDSSASYAMNNLLDLPLHGLRMKNDIDLVIGTHADDDHLDGIKYLYDKVIDGVADPKEPLLTWIPEYRNPTTSFSVPTTTYETTMGSLADFIEAEVVFPKTKRAETDVEEIMKLIKRKSWTATYAAKQLNGGGLDEVDLAGVKVKYLGPRQADVTTWWTALKKSNETSIINTINSLRYPTFTSLWTGDAVESATGENGRVSTGATWALRNVANKHFKFLKVSHHGSRNKSNTEAFFYKVTADNYIISANGTHGHPTLQVLGWIVKGHYTKFEDMRQADSAAVLPPPPSIWITNPWFTSSDRRYFKNMPILNIDLHGAHIWQRWTLNDDRKTEDGHLHFRVLNGLVVGFPLDAAAKIPPAVADMYDVKAVTSGMPQLTTK